MSLLSQHQKKRLKMRIFPFKSCHVFYHIFITGGRFLSHGKDKQQSICAVGNDSEPLLYTLFDFAVFIRSTLPPFTQKRSVEIQAAPSYCSRPKFGRFPQAAASLVNRSCCWRVISRLAETTLTAAHRRLVKAVRILFGVLRI